MVAALIGVTAFAIIIVAVAIIKKLFIRELEQSGYE